MDKSVRYAFENLLDVWENRPPRCISDTEKIHGSKLTAVGKFEVMRRAAGPVGKIWHQFHESIQLGQDTDTIEIPQAFVEGMALMGLQTSDKINILKAVQRLLESYTEAITAIISPYSDLTKKIMDSAEQGRNLLSDMPIFEGGGEVEIETADPEKEMDKVLDLFNRGEISSEERDSRLRYLSRRLNASVSDLFLKGALSEDVMRAMTRQAALRTPGMAMQGFYAPLGFAPTAGAGRITLVTDFGQDLPLRDEAGKAVMTVPRFGAWAPRQDGKLEVVDTASSMEELERRNGPLPKPQRLDAGPAQGKKEAGWSLTPKQHNDLRFWALRQTDQDPKKAEHLAKQTTARIRNLPAELRRDFEGVLQTGGWDGVSEWLGRHDRNDSMMLSSVASGDKFDEFRGIWGQDRVDTFLAAFGLGPKYVPKKPRTHACPKCGKKNATFKEVHPDTDMNDVVLSCPDCGFEDS